MSQATIRPLDVLRSITSHPWRVITPVIALTLLALVYALTRPTTWEASQALIVRDEAGDRLTRPGKFTHTDEMKTSQETILELVKSRSVLAKALSEVGPPTDQAASAAWPSEKDLEALQARVRVTPPKGAEFGKTEVFYLKVPDCSQERAVGLAEAICHQLQGRFAELRESKARSTTDELTKTVSLAQADLDDATRTLGGMEESVGGDLAELRILNESPSGDSDLRRTAIELEKELRGYRAANSEGQEFLTLLAAGQIDPNRLLASPSVLLKSQPALGRLKDGLVDAQLRTGLAQGTMSDDHPIVKAARAGEQAIREQLHDEIRVAIKGVEGDLRVNADRIRALETQNAAIQQRLARLAAVRAQYANLVTATKSRGETLKLVEHDLAEARASQAAARSGSLINLVDRPDTGARPIGPGRTTIVLAGFAGGIAVAMSIVFLTVRPASPPHVSGRRVGRSSTPRVAEPAVSLNLKQALKRVSGARL
jgi:uncharacterized protein involved in exopolysaccharide biosynthesis